MKDWKTFFETRLTQGGKFVLSNKSHSGETETLIFRHSSTDNLTTIEIGIFDNGDLITFEVHNPLTPGFSEQQRREYFYKYSFHPSESYGGPGLEYVQLNIDHFEKFLKEGLRGKEIQYFRKGKLIKSEVFQLYTENGLDEYPTTIAFEKVGFWRMIINALKHKELYDEKKELELREIFSGIN